MGSSLVAIIADNQKPSLNLVQKQKAFGWWEQFVAGADLEPDTFEPQQTFENESIPAADPQPNGTLRLEVDNPGTEAFGRNMTILEGFKGGKVELSARFAIAGEILPEGEAATLSLIAKIQKLGDSGFTTINIPAQLVGEAIVIDDSTGEDIQEIRAVFEPGGRTGDNLAIGIVLKKTAGSTTAQVDIAGLQIGQILQQSVPRGGNR